MTDPQQSPAKDRPRDHAAALAIILAGLVVIFRSDLFSGADLFFKAFRDINPITLSYPWSRLELLSWQQGLFPLWNPYNLLGAPLLANYQSAVLSPLLWPIVFGPIETIAVPYLFLRVLLAGWGTFIFCRSIGVPRSGAITGAVAFSLTGFMMQYVNDQHVVIDLMIPWLLLAGGRLVTKGRALDLAAVTAAAVLVLVGGQPGSALFTLALGYGYALFMALTRRGRTRAGIMLLAGSGAASIVIALPQLLPFIEFIPKAWTFHGPGFGAEHVPAQGMVTMIAPGFFGPLDSARLLLPLIKIAPYLGLTVAALATAGTLRARRGTDIFFAGALVVGLGILAGIPPFSLIARVPGLDRLTFIKYLQPLIAFSAAVLAARCAGDTASGRGRLALSLTCVVMAGLVLIARFLFGPMFPQAIHAMNGACLVGAVFGGCLLLVSLLSGRSGRLAGAAVTALVLVELVVASFVNVPFMSNNVARADLGALEEAREFDPLARTASSEETYLPNMNLLVPAFDAGISDAMIIRESFELFGAVAGLSGHELFLHYINYHSLRLPLSEHGPVRSSMLGARFLLSRLPLPANTTIPLMLWSETIMAPSPSHVSYQHVEIGKDLKESLFAHPPCRIVMDTGESGKVVFSIGIKPEAWDLPGDGVWFMLSTEDPDGLSPSPEKQSVLEWARYIDPRARDRERFWLEVAVGPLQKTEAAWTTLPAAGVDHDWAVWGDPRVGDDRAMSPACTTEGVRIYEDDRAFPRAFLATRILHGDGEVSLQKIVAMESPGTAMVPEEPSSPEAGELQGGDAGVSRYGLQGLSCDVRSEGPGFLVLGDAYYPGWRAVVNGKEQRIIRTNHGLRGVMVPPGESTVELSYEPFGFRVGLWCGLSGLALAACFWWGPWRRRS